MFDVKKIAQRYYLVLEPSWSGFCDLDILCYLSFDFPVFLQTYEPRDKIFVDRLHSNLIPVPIAANFFVDHRIFHPILNAKKDVDLIMVASWARFKRHSAFFSALAQLRARGKRLQTVLIGYRNDYSLDDIYYLARYYGIEDQLEIYERITPKEVNHHYNRAKINIVWSRREGFNRALIEGLFAGIPCIIPAGFNYGYRYPFINARTGCFATQRDLPDKLLTMIDNLDQYSPREWVFKHMNCQHATKTLDETIGFYARQCGENWTGELAVKVSHLDAMSYWDESERGRFDTDYIFLQSMLHRNHLTI